MLKINEDIERSLLENNGDELGHYSEYGAVIGEELEFVLVYKDDNVYLAHISEFEVDGIFIRLKENKK